MPYLFTSPRLGFRNWKQEDAALFIQMNQDPEVMEFFPSPLSVESSLAYLEKIQKLSNELDYALYAVETLANKEFIGCIGFWPTTFEAAFTPCVEIMWRLRKEHWNQGYATEGAKACLTYGYETLGLHEIYSFTATINKRSERVMQKIGMMKIGEFEHPKVEKGHRLSQHVLYRKKLALTTPKETQ